MMYSAWTKHLKTQEEKDKFVKGLQSCKWVFERQAELLNEIKNDIDKAEVSPRIYDSPNWEYRQAHINGFKQHHNMVMNLINLDPKE
jgi:hypothetical protein